MTIFPGRPRSEQLFFLGNKAIIRDHLGRVLLLNFKPASMDGYWDLPGGRVNRGEDILDGLAREVKEETGASGLTGIRHLGMAISPIQIPISSDEKAGLILSIYAAAAADMSQIATETGVKMLWCTPPSVPELISQYPHSLLATIKSELNV